MSQDEQERTWNTVTGKLECNLHDTRLILQDTFGLEGEPDEHLQHDMLYACYKVVATACGVLKGEGLLHDVVAKGFVEETIMRTATITLEASHVNDPGFPTVVYVTVVTDGRRRLRWRQEADTEHVQSMKPDTIIIPDVQSLYWVVTRFPKLVDYALSEKAVKPVNTNVWEACAAVGCPDGYRHAPVGFSEKF